MFKIISEPHSDTVAIKISAAVDKEQYELALPQLEDKIKTHGKINLYCEIENIASISPGAIWEDLKFDSRHLNDFKRVAIVGDEEWQQWMSKFGNMVSPAEVKYYDPAHKADAMQWVIGPDNLKI